MLTSGTSYKPGAAKLTIDQANAFNGLQRGHHNALETFQSFLVLSFVAGFVQVHCTALFISQSPTFFPGFSAHLVNPLRLSTINTQTASRDCRLGPGLECCSRQLRAWLQRQGWSLCWYGYPAWGGLLCVWPPLISNPFVVALGRTLSSTGAFKIGVLHFLALFAVVGMAGYQGVVWSGLL